MKKRILSLALVLVIALGLLTMTAGAADHTYKSWSQGDSRWGSMSISSNGTGNNSMARVGCYVTAIAKLLVHAGQQDPAKFTPKECLQGLLAHGMLSTDGGIYYGSFNNSFLPTYGPQLYKETSDSHGEWGKNTAVSTIGGKIRDGYYVIVCVINRATGNTHYMAVDYVSDDIYVMDNGGVYAVYGSGRYSGVTDQVYFKYSGPHPYPAVDYIGQSSSVTIQPGLYSLAPACAPDSRLEVADGSMTIEANVHIGNANNDSAQQWEISALGDGYYKLISKKSGLALDVAGAGTTAGTNVQQYWWTENRAQHWSFIDAGDGYYEIATRLNGGLRLDVNGGAAANRTNVQIWTRNGGTPQKWKLIPVETTPTPEPVPNCDKGHTWGNWETVEEATCEAAGQQERTCNVCGETETKAVDALAHDYRVKQETDTSTLYVCRNCGDSYMEEKEPVVVDNSGMGNFVAKNSYSNGLFRDVKSGDWFSSNVATAYSMGLMNGTGGSSFSPGNNMTLAEVVTLAARIHKIYYTGSDSFPSYDGGNWYDPYVDYARDNGIIDTNYAYSRPATREEVVHILARALPEEELANTVGRVSFADSGEITYMADVRLLSGAGVINGIQEGGLTYFKPLSPITRAEVAAVVGRMVRPGTRVGK